VQPVTSLPETAEPHLLRSDDHPLASADGHVGTGRRRSGLLISAPDALPRRIGAKVFGECTESARATPDVL
jgi:hypothetical protein